MTRRAGERGRAAWDLWCGWLVASSISFGIGYAVSGAMANKGEASWKS